MSQVRSRRLRACVVSRDVCRGGVEVRVNAMGSEGDREEEEQRGAGALRQTVFGAGGARPRGARSACLGDPLRDAAWMIKLRDIDYMGGGG